MPSLNRPPAPIGIGPSVAALLSQLQASSGGPSAALLPPGETSHPSDSVPGPPSYAEPQPTYTSPAGPSSGVQPEFGPALDQSLKLDAPAPHTPPQDMRTCTFQQALPHLARLAEDPEFLKVLTAIRTEQTELERQLWKERLGIQRKHEDKVRAARTQASIVGVTGFTQYEADSLSATFRAELRRFDRDRALPAWDGLVARQQAALEGWHAPAMFLTSHGPDREVRAPTLISDSESSMRHACCAPVCIRTLARRGPRMHDGPRTELAHGCPLLWVQRSSQGLAACTATAHRRSTLLSRLDVSFPLSPPRRAAPAMPFVDLVNTNDYASIWYTANSPAGTVSGFDPRKPTLVMLHPTFLDSTWTHPQINDNRLNANFNIVVFDTRITGKSLYRPSGRYDLWVVAADLAYCFYHLQLPPAHIFAPELLGLAALRFAALFPELCLSLTLCNVTPQTELKSIFDAFEELSHLWCYAEDLESFETACKEMVNCYAQDAHPDFIDELVAHWEVHYPPFRRSHVIQNVNLILNRTPMSAHELANVRCPVLIIQAERSQTHPMEYAQQLRQALVNAPDTAQLFTVKATHGYLSLLSSSIVNQVLNKFLTRQQSARSDLFAPEIPLLERMQMALDLLAEFRDDPSISERDASSPLSFCCVTEEVRKSQEDLYSLYREGEQNALSPLAPDGRPLRKYSERKDEHWLDSSTDGFSYSNIKQPGSGKDKKRPAVRRPVAPVEEASVIFMPSEPVTQEAQQVARIRRATVLPQSPADKHVIKGSMAKVIASGAGTSLQRRLLRG
ncbi:alpha/beta-hydrolase [Epithele typhae]|uniref:alpha/beta-hydrolase n=1 Tax=Epithele typhae TaxID=378194 RepID=UPI0020074337|nr:alpha/beta-hydrolase [Epithele typhae]KAH9943003.1 alpha/beta-hydrolase [Epithele typhae]